MNVLIVGASRGLGLEWVKQLSERKYQVYATYRRPHKSDSLHALQRSFPENIHLFECDIREDSGIQFLASQLKSCAPFDWVIQNGGIYGDFARQSLNQLDRATLLETFNVNAASQILMARAMLPMIKQRGKLCFITSKMGSIDDNHSGDSYPYRASKAALNMLQMSFSRDSILKQVYSLCVHPGWVKTDMGGMDAPIEVTESVSGMMSVLDAFHENMHGGFFDYKGNRIAW